MNFKKVNISNFLRTQCCLLVFFAFFNYSSAQFYKKYLPKLPSLKLPVKEKNNGNKFFDSERISKYVKDSILNKSQAMPMAVGYTDFDENLRDLKLLGIIQTENSLTIRPYITRSTLPYDSILKYIDTSIQNYGHIKHTKHLDIQLLPINFLQKYNSKRPYGWNDGPLSFSKGYQTLISGGVYLRWYNFHLNIRPEFFKTASDSYERSGAWGQVTPSLSKIIWGQSDLRMDLGPISIGIANQNIWRGPGYYSSLLMSNNAQGFKHYYFNTNKPLKTPLGSFELSVLGATLTQNKTQGFENKNLFTANVSENTRYINMLTLTYSPVFFKNLYLGANRVFHQFSRTTPSTNFKKDYLPVLLPLFRNVYQDNAEAIDQLISGFIKYSFPKEHAELYFEYGWNDGKSNARDLNLDNSHSSASILGFKKLFEIKNKQYIGIEAEATRMAQTPSYLLRNAGNWYEHGQLTAGYTNENQTLGAGSGFGNNVQTILTTWNRGWTKYGIKFQRIEQQPRRFASSGADAYLGDTDWNDYCYGFVVKQRYKKILLNAQVDWVHSKNYLWQENKQLGNLYFFLNTIYIW